MPSWPVHRSFAVFQFALAFCIGAAHITAATDLPDLAKLKLAAEAGDAQAQYDYGQRTRATNPKESFAMLLQSANQGFGPAENAVGAEYDRQTVFDLKKRAECARLAARYTSRAAYKGFADAQSRLSEFYQRGGAVPKSPVLAYAWAAIALKSAGGPNQLRGVVQRTNLDTLVARTPSDVIAEGQKIADAFHPITSGINPVELDVIKAQMRITGVISSGTKSVVINQTRFVEGETKSLPIDGSPVILRCLKIEDRAARLAMGDYEFVLNRP